ncbi:MAG: hypothetical protein IJU57_04715 [Clostridia bacterium]|nr:hypothetical protein [Clostridia bacterium]
MGKYFIYYSATGNGDFISGLYKAAGYRTIKIEMEKPIRKTGLLTILKYGGQAMTGKKARIKDPGYVPEKGDTVVIGSPVWNDRLSTPVNALLARYDFDRKTTSFVLYPAGEKTSRSLAQIKKLGFVKEPVVVRYPLKYPEETKAKLGLAE